MATKQATAPKWAADKIEHWPIGKLLPYAKNPRTHSGKQVSQIVEAIRKYGWTAPVLVDEKGELLAGHGRVMAAAQLKLTTIPTMVARGWSEADKRAYRIWDNQSVLLGDWNAAYLSEELRFLEADGYDLNLTGFADAELVSFMANLEVDHGALLELVDVTLNEPLSAPEPGDHYLLDGRHHLFCESVVSGWPKWQPFLTGDAMFVPFAGVYVPFSKRAAERTFVMVQPDPYICGHIVDRFVEVKGKKHVHKISG